MYDYVWWWYHILTVNIYDYHDNPSIVDMSANLLIYVVTFNDIMANIYIYIYIYIYIWPILYIYIYI